MRILTELSAGEVVDADNDAAAGVPAVFVELFQGECTQLVRFAALLGADDPEDVVQEAFCRLFRSWHKVRNDNRTPYYGASSSTRSDLAIGT